MKYTIEGLQQQELVDRGLDANDAVILRWFADWVHSGNMDWFEDEWGDRWYWLRYEKVIEELPVLGIKTKDGVYRRMRKMQKANVVEGTTVNEKNGVVGTYTFYRLRHEFTQLTGNGASEKKGKRVSKNRQGSDEKPRGVGRKTEEGSDSRPEGGRMKSRTKDSSTRDSSTMTLSLRDDAVAPPHPALKDPLSNAYRDAFNSEHPIETWSNFAREQKSCNDLAKKTRLLSENTGIEVQKLGAMILETFQSMVRENKYSSFWKTAAFTPSEVLSRWDKIVTGLQGEAEKQDYQKYAAERLQELHQKWARMR